MLRIYLAVFLLAFFTTKDVYAQLPTPSSQDSCIQIFKEYSKHWKKDKHGKNGFRELFGRTIFKNCNLKGAQWRDISGYLGKPTHKGSREGIMVYLYRLNYFSRNIKLIGTFLLEIDVNEKGQIVLFGVFEVDG